MSSTLTPDALVTRLRAEVADGDDLALAATPTGAGFAWGGDRLAIATLDAPALVAAIDAAVAPRWVWWDRDTSRRLAQAKVRPARCWDVLTVERLLQGGWSTSIARAWARHFAHDPAAVPAMGQLGLLDVAVEPGDPESPVQPDGHLRPDWVAGGWAASPSRLADWAALALRVTDAQRAELAARGDAHRSSSSARSESAADLLCAELEVDGLPIDLAEMSSIIADAIGPRPIDERDAERTRRARDERVVDLLPPGSVVDLRNPNEVRAMLRRVAVDVPDTRAWRLERHRDDHPVVEALLTWRKAERIATTYGYRWLDQHVRDGRLRGEWTSCDGAAGRMTASAGLHNLPAELRPAVAAEPGHRFVRADLGQIEPRVLAAVSGDRALIAAADGTDLYRPVAERLGVTRDVAKVAVLGAMYGSTTGESANALRGLEREYPVAMGYLEAFARDGREGRDITTIGGRRVRMWLPDTDGDIDRARSVAAARGRYARNAAIQGAAAEFFKVWAVLVRTRIAALDARIVLCLHDELLVHVTADHASECEEVVVAALDEAAHRWSPSPGVRFVADVSTVVRWSDAK